MARFMLWNKNEVLSYKILLLNKDFNFVLTHRSTYADF